MTTMDILNRVLGSRMSQRFLGVGSPIKIFEISRILKNTGNEMIQGLLDFSTLAPQMHVRGTPENINRTLFVQMKIQCVLRGFYPINTEGFYNSIALSLDLGADGQHKLRLLLLCYLHTNRKVYTDNFGVKGYNSYIKKLLDGEGDESVLQVVAEMLHIRIVQYVSFGDDKAELHHFVPLHTKSNAILAIASVISQQTPNPQMDNGMEKPLHFPLKYQLKRDIMEERASRCIYHYSNVTEHVPFTVIKDEPVSDTETDIIERVITLELKNDDIVQDIASSFFRNNTAEQAVLINSPTSIQLFPGANKKDYDFLKNEFEMFELTNTELLQVNDHGLYYLDRVVVPATKSNNTIEKDKNTNLFKMRTGSTNEFDEILRKDSTVESCIYTRKPTRIDRTRQERMRDTLEGLQYPNIFGNPENGFPGISPTTIVGVEGSIVPISFAKYYGSHLVLNLGPENLEIRVIGRQGSFMLMDILGGTSEATSLQIRNKSVNIGTLCDFACEKKMFLTGDYLASMSIKSDIIVVGPNQMLVTRSGSMLQLVFSGLSVCTMYSMPLNEYPDILETEAGFHPCKSNERQYFKRQNIIKLVELVQKRIGNEEIEMSRQHAIQTFENPASAGSEDSEIDYTTYYDYPNTGTTHDEGTTNDDEGTANEATTQDEEDTAISKKQPKDRKTKRKSIKEKPAPSETPVSEPVGRRTRSWTTGAKSNDEQSSLKKEMKVKRGRKPVYKSPARKDDDTTTQEEEEELTTPLRGKKKQSSPGDSPAMKRTPRRSSSKNSQSAAEEPTNRRLWAVAPRKPAPKTGKDSKGKEPKGKKRETLPRKAKADPTYNTESSSDSTSGDEDSNQEGANVERRYVCGVHDFDGYIGTCKCGKAYKRCRHLYRHIEQHRSGRKFPCPQCDYKAKTTTDLNRHIMIKHLPDTQFACPYCPLSFPVRDYLIMHWKLKHANLPRPPPKKRNEVMNYLRKMHEERSSEEEEN